MKNSIVKILVGYGFEVQSDSTLWWGVGSLVWGHIAEVTPLGKDLYKVQYRRWLYNDCGECVADVRETAVLHGALALQYLFERLPLFR